MNDKITSQETAAVIDPGGDLVAARLPELRSKLKEMVGSGVLQMTMDLAYTKMLDSAGIGLLISAHNSLKKVGGEFKVIHASKDVFDLLRTMRIHQHFSVSGI